MISCNPGWKADGSTSYTCFPSGEWGAGAEGLATRCVIPDACESHPCVVAGDGQAVCTDIHLAASSVLPRYRCECSSGWSGDNCERIADVCASSPCQNGGECRGFGHGYQCICQPGWRGRDCVEDYNECLLPGLCEHEAVCSESTTDSAVAPGQFHCACNAGYEGTRCQVLLDHCISDTPRCENGGRCRSTLDGFKCKCAAGYAGAACQTDVDECASLPCQHGGACVDGADSFQCACASGFRGKTCNREVNECLSRPCQNGGNCRDLVDAYVCSCIGSYGGDSGNCDQVTENPCKNGGLQIDPVQGTCRCASGWQGPTCEEDIDECASRPCQNNARCRQGMNRYDCICRAGFASGALDTCELDVDECSSLPCENGAACEAGNQVVGPDAYQCTCAEHYLGENCAERESYCADVPCGMHGICTDGLNDYVCSCLSGYEGRNCDNEIDVCLSRPCDHDGACTSHRGVYRCDCPSGWRGDNCAENVDECISRPCAHGGRCLDQYDAYACRCIAGWYGDNCELDINECSSIPCENGGACVDRLASYSCQCPSGWEGDNCLAEIDECASYPCRNGECEDGFDSFTCTCIEGWSGVKCTEDVDECASSPCKNDMARCDDLIGMYICTCGYGWEGENCEVSSIHDIPVDADGEPVLANIEVGGEEVFFSFEALPGGTYQIETEILGLEDSVLTLYDHDRQTQLAENDDYDIGRDSFLEWTAPSGGTFYFGVHAYDETQTGDFYVYLNELPNPCTEGITLDMPAASVSFMPDGDYADDAMCDWTINCPDSLVSLTFTQLDTEADYDVISLYDGEFSDSSPLLGEMSGQIEDAPTTEFLSTGPVLLVEFMADESQSGGGFEIQYSCDSLESHRVYTPLPTDGAPITMEIAESGDQVWFAFDATMGTTYNIRTQLLGLEDTVMHLYDTDASRQLAENDDSNGGADSFLQWTAPTDGSYSIMVHAYDPTQTGTFSIAVSLDSGNPCAGGVTLTEASGVVSFMPDGNYRDDAECDWYINCGSVTPSLTFTRLDTELNFDTVSVYSGSDESPMATLSGHLADQPQTNFVPPDNFMHLQFSADASVGGAGFEVRYQCGRQVNEDRDFMQIQADGTVTTTSIEPAGSERWFAFSGLRGSTYQIQVRLLGLVDSVMHLFDVDSRTQLAENDDANFGRDSFLEWTCPADGIYFVMVHAFTSTQTGDFELSVLEMADAGNPCEGGMVLSMSSGVVNFMPNGDYGSNMNCGWTIDCGDATVTATVNRLDTEAEYDLVNLYDGAEASPEHAMTEAPGLSGRLADLATTEFGPTTATGMVIQFTADDSVGGAGFEVAYRCNTASMNRQITPLATDGVAVITSIAEPGSQRWYSFHGVEGATYQMSTGLLGLGDTIMHLFDSDMETQLAENDDSAGRRESYIEWVCPYESTFYVMVHAFDSTETGDFQVSVLEQYVAGSAGDPCRGTGAVFVEPAATISYMPEGNYEDDALCDWAIDCGEGNTMTLTFNRLDTETDYDVVSIYDGDTPDAAILADLSGDLMDYNPADTTFTSTGNLLLIEFLSDETLGAAGFEADYACSNSGRVAGSGVASLDAQTLDTAGVPITYDIEVPGDEGWFSFEGYSGTTYQVETELIGLPDTVMYLYDTDGVTQLAENDDSGVASASYLEWTCPADGIYYVRVNGYAESQTGEFRVRVTQLGSNGEGDPCVTGAVLEMASATISHMPAGNYEADALCEWQISCGDDGPVSLTFSQLETEVGYDIVTIFDGMDAGAPLLTDAFDEGGLSGSLDDLSAAERSYESTGGDMFLEFSADESIGAGGFEASYVCAGAASASRATHVRSDGVRTVWNLESVGDHAWFSFDASQGSSYEIQTELLGLPDSVMHLYATDGQEQLAENDDSSDGRDSYLEWTSPAAGTYYIMIHAYDPMTQRGEFALTVTETGRAGGVGDPCTTGATLTAHSAVVTFMPDGNYEDDSLCTWTIDCGDSTAELRMMRLDTEVDYDLVSLYDGDPDASPDLLAEMSGQFLDLETTEFSSQSHWLTIEFSSDESVSGNGFEASYSCGEDQSADTVLRVETDGAEHLGDINVPGKRFWYSFAGSAGYTYQIATQLRGLDDSVMVIFADDMETRIAENDDNGNARSSYLEWQCPFDATYYVMVRAYGASATGDFAFSIEQVAVSGESGDPCLDGQTVDLYDATITYMPAGANQPCRIRYIVV